MPVQVSYPGVYIQEISSGSRTITGVSTSVALFIGMAEQGPMDTPVRTLSLTEFERTFGASNSLGELHEQVKQFYLNGGSTAWIMRIANGDSSSAVTLETQDGTTDALTLTARSAGLIGENLRAIVDYNTATPEMTFNLTVQLWGVSTGGSPAIVTSESFKELSMDPNQGKYVVNVLAQNSTLVTATDPAAAATIDGYTVWGKMEEAAATFTNLEDAIGASPAIGRFMVSVDDGPYVPVALTGAMSESAIKDAIDLALQPQNKTVAVSLLDIDGGGTGTYHAYRISATGSRRIRFAPYSGDEDIAVEMMMAADRGALEVDGYAVRRPAPNGLFSSLDIGSDALLQATLGTFVHTDLSAVTEVRLTDVQAGAPFDISVTWTAAGGTVAKPTGASAPTLQAVQQNLDALATALNNATGVKWVATRHGHRLVMTPEFGGDAGDVSATLRAQPLAASFDDYFGATSGTTTNATRYQIGGNDPLPGAYQVDAGTGSDGTKPSKDDYDDAYEIAEREIDLFNLLVLPRADGQSDSERLQLWGAASVFAKNNRAFLLVDPPSTWNEYSDVSSEIANLRIGVATDHAAIYWPRINVNTSTGTKPIDPSGAIAGIMARTDATRGVWKAPAGLEANLLGVRGVEHAMSDADNGVINPLAVNAIRAFPNGIVSWGARTMVGFDNSGNDDYKYVPIRRLALYIEESLYRGLKWAVFEPNDAPLWRQLRASAGAFMNNLFRQGAFAGEKASDAYFVKVDRDTTTQNDINLGVVNVVIGFAPLKPAEFVVITLQQKAGEIQI